MKKVFAFVLSIMLAVCGFSAVSLAENEKINIVTTIFPIYDWVREMTADMDCAEITLLLDNGTDLHSYQPTAQDILKISSADLFIYVGGESDEWVRDVLETAVNPELRGISLVEAMGEDIRPEEIVEGMEHEHEHDHDEDEDEDHDEDHDEHDHHDHEDGEEEYDEHVWLSLRNAQKLVAVITDTLCQIDSAHADAYKAKAAAYIEKLAALDARYTEMIGEAAFHTFLFADRFPFRYLADDYGLTYFAAFSGCSAESEASFQTIVFLAQKVDELGLPAVLTIEHPQTRIAETVLQATATGNQRILSMDSMQGTTAQDIANGATYLKIMEANLAVLKEALN